MKRILLFVFAISSASALIGLQNTENCLICLQPLFLQDSRRLGCSHAYHQECWDPWKCKERFRISSFVREGIKEIQSIRCPACMVVVYEPETIVYKKSGFLKKAIIRMRRLFK